MKAVIRDSLVEVMKLSARPEVVYTLHPAGGSVCGEDGAGLPDLKSPIPGVSPLNDIVRRDNALTMTTTTQVCVDEQNKVLSTSTTGCGTEQTMDDGSSQASRFTTGATVEVDQVFKATGDRK